MRPEVYKRRISCMIIFLLLSSYNTLYAQLSKEDSLHISHILKQEGEIKLNQEAIKAISFQNNHLPKMEHTDLLNAIIFKPTMDLYQQHLLLPEFHLNYQDYSSISLNKWNIRAFIDENSSKTFHPQTDKSINVLINYRFNKKFSLDLFGGYVYRAFLPQLLYDKEVGTRIIYKISDRIKIHTGFQLQYNKKSHEWGSGFFGGVSYNLH